MKKINAILKTVWLWVTGRYDKLSSKENVDIAIKVVNVIKNLAQSQVAQWGVALTATGIDDKVLRVILDRTPKLLAALQLMRDLPERATEAQIQEVLSSFLRIINADEFKREWLLTSLSASILKALEDDILTMGEAAAIVEKHYQEGE